MQYKIDIDVTKWQGVTPSGEEEEINGEELEGDLGQPEFGGEGFELPGGGEQAPEAIAAMTRLAPETLLKNILGKAGIAPTIVCNVNIGGTPNGSSDPATS